MSSQNIGLIGQNIQHNYLKWALICSCSLLPTNDPFLIFSEFSVQTSPVRFSDVGGCDATIKEICKLLLHLRHPEVFTWLGVAPPQGFLLHGPPGCGKTLLAHAIAGVRTHLWQSQVENEHYSTISGLIRLVISLECFIEITPDYLCPFMNN